MDFKVICGFIKKKKKKKNSNSLIQKERREGQRSRKKLQGEAVIQVIRNNWKIEIRRNKKEGERECGVSEFQKVP